MLESLFNKAAQVFSFEICEIFKNSFFTEHLQKTASGVYHDFCKIFLNTCSVDHIKTAASEEIAYKSKSKRKLSHHD